MKFAASLTAVVAGVLIAVAAGGTKTAERPTPTVPWTVEFKEEKKEATCNKWKIVKGIRFYRASAWTWNWQAGVPFTRFSKWKPNHSCEFLNYLGTSARKKARAARISFNRWFSAAYAKWECIHNHEGAWNSNTGNGYYGGLQMDTSFQSAYGSDFIRLWGTANNWPIWAQLRAAERAYATRGFGPWPTRRFCGL